MKKLIVLVFLIALPGAAFALEQSFTQQGLKAIIKLTPEKLETESNVQFSLSLSKNGAPLADKDVSLEIFERNVEQPVIKRQVDALDNEYIDSWKFEKAGDYKVVVKVVDHQKPNESMQYEVNANVIDAGGEHSEHGFFAHHFSGKGKWGWWGAGLMILIMVPVMIL